jgi:hypoxanthine-guanine phosphoribosyltransferase
MRQYVKNLIVPYTMIKRRSQFVNKKVLVVDDTVGSGATFSEIQRILGKYKAKEIYFFALLKDYK